MSVSNLVSQLLTTSIARRQEGQGMVEYALIIFLVSVVSIAILTTLGGQISSVFSSANAAL
ncbi:MAG: Flp family type IVb pilin [Chloroflexi bacterium]|nr:Flp family type IVb pilin [Chloroflexota bacterium]